MRVLSKLADYSEYLQRVGALQTETHPKVDAQLINGLVEKVLGKGRYTLTEIEGYDVGEREGSHVDPLRLRHPHAGLQAGQQGNGGR